MKYAVFNILIIVLVGLLYTSGVILFIIAIKIMGIPTSKN